MSQRPSTPGQILGVRYLLSMGLGISETAALCGLHTGSARHVGKDFAPPIKRDRSRRNRPMTVLQNKYGGRMPHVI